MDIVAKILKIITIIAVVILVMTPGVLTQHTDVIWRVVVGWIVANIVSLVIFRKTIRNLIDE